MFGRKRAVPELRGGDANTRSFGERLAVNSPVQGTAADIIKIAMINLWNSLNSQKLLTRIILQVHDELVFEAPESELDTAKKMIREKMEGAVVLAVPLRVDLGYGRTWAEAHE
jgi:DNA polymerase-1